MQRVLGWLRHGALRRQGEITPKFLIDTSILLASSLDYQTTLMSVVQLATSTVADWCAIDLVDEDGVVRRAAVAHRDPEKEQIANELQRRYPALEQDQTHTIRKVLNSGKSWFDPHVSTVRLRDEARDSEHWRLLKSLGFKAEIVVPLTARDKTLGTLTLVLGEGRRSYTQADLIRAEELARRVALAIDNARLYQQAETQREQFEAVMTRYRDLVENANDVIYTLDMSGKLTSINRAGEEITGYMRDELLNTPIARIVVPTYLELMKQMLERKSEGGGRTRYEVEIMAKDGRLLTLEISSQLMTQGDEQVGIQGIARDITERKQAEQQAERLQAVNAALYAAEQQARMQAEAANRLKVQFLAMISHELRSPLTAIKGFTSSLLATDVEWEPQQQREFIALADAEADRLKSLIEHLLDVTRLEAGTLPIRIERQMLSEVVRGVQEQLKALTIRHQFTIDLPADLPEVMVDGQRIGQVLTNLVDNASKYAPASTRITLSAKAVHSDVQVSVADEGEGISPEERTSVFEAFRQGEHRARHSTGAGLGLAICKGLVEAHGGTIWVEDVEVGTTISFTLPAAEE